MRYPLLHRGLYGPATDNGLEMPQGRLPGRDIGLAASARAYERGLICRGRRWVVGFGSQAELTGWPMMAGVGSPVPLVVIWGGARRLETLGTVKVRVVRTFRVERGLVRLDGFGSL